jgi:hypothetical protein
VKFPHLANADWRERNATRIASIAAGGQQPSAAPSVTQKASQDNYRYGGGDIFAFTSVHETPSDIAEVSEQAMRFAHRTEYKERTIVDTGATDHICNDLSKFTEWRQTPTRTGIKTGVGIVKVLGTGTIKLSLLCANGTIH